jgi:DNA-binding response OmpR family regulator
MIIQNLIIYQFTSFYKILKEIEKELNFNITETVDYKTLKTVTSELDNYVIISKKVNSKIISPLIIEKFPIKILKVIEKINIEFLKKKFNDQSNIQVNNYKINLNSRQIISENKKLKLTEKEVNTIIYLSNAQNPVSPLELQKNVWSYQSDLETHTVETHIYRLRKKFLETFGDKRFILSFKNGYKIE